MFDANASKIGLLKAKDAQDVVSTYVLTKAHVEDLITWPATDPDTPFRPDLFDLLKNANHELMARIPKLVSTLREY